MFSRTLVMGLMCVAMVLSSCGDDDSDNGGSKRNPYGDRRIDTSNFQNKASEREFKAKGQEVDGYFENLNSVKSSFLASGAANSLIKGLTQVNDGGLSDLGDCQQVASTETTDWGEQLNVVTTTCKRPIEGGTETCVTTRKTNLEGDVVSETVSCIASSSSSSDEESDTATDGGNQYVPSFDDVQDCDSAFDSFEESYAGLKSEFDSMYGMLVEPTGLNLNGAGLTDLGELKKVENDDKSAVTYEFVSPESSGMKMSGSISGGANETTLLLRQDLKFAMDFSQMMPTPSEGAPTSPSGLDPTMPGQSDMGSGSKMAMTSNGTIAVDMEQKLIEQDVDMSMTMGEGTNAMVMSTKGRIALSAGEEKFVIANLDVSSGNVGQVTSSRLEMETRLVDADTLSYKATMSGSGDAAQSGTMSFLVKRDGDGTCKVTDRSNTF